MGYEALNWELLKKELLKRFGRSLPLVKYPKQNLKNLFNSAVARGGISDIMEFKVFRTKFEAITDYCVSIEKFRENLLEALSTELESALTKEIIRENKMIASKEGGHILADAAALVTYIHREV